MIKPIYILFNYGQIRVPVATAWTAIPKKDFWDPECRTIYNIPKSTITFLRNTLKSNDQLSGQADGTLINYPDSADISYIKKWIRNWNFKEETAAFGPYTGIYFFKKATWSNKTTFFLLIFYRK
jgi:hypothetical protein